MCGVLASSAPGRTVTELGLVTMRRNCARMGVFSSAAGILRNASYSCADGERGNPELLAPAQDSGIRRIAAQPRTLRSLWHRPARLGGRVRLQHLERAAAVSRQEACIGKWWRGNPREPLHRVAGRMEPGILSTSTWATANDCTPRQGSGV